MPVITGLPRSKSLSRDKMNEVVRTIQSVLGRNRHNQGMLIYQIPLSDGRKDVVVIWDGWGFIIPNDRRKIILKAFNDSGKKIGVAVGATFVEAASKNLLPYSILPSDIGDTDSTIVEDTMIELGGYREPDGRTVIHLPNREMASQTVSELSARLSDVSWRIVETPEW